MVGISMLPSGGGASLEDYHIPNLTNVFSENSSSVTEKFYNFDVPEQ